jgi:hypothetical protein
MNITAGETDVLAVAAHFLFMKLAEMSNLRQPAPALFRMSGPMERQQRVAHSLPDCPSCGTGMAATSRFVTVPVKPPTFACQACGVTVLGYDPAIGIAGSRSVGE